MKDPLLVIDLLCSLGLATGALIAVVAPRVRGRASARLSTTRISVMSLGLAAIAGVAFAVGLFGVGAFFAAAAAALCTTVTRPTAHPSAPETMLEATMQRYGEFAIFLGIGIHVRHDALNLGLVELALVGSFMASYATAKAAAFGVADRRGSIRRAQQSLCLLAGAAVVPIARAGLPETEGNLALLPITGALAVAGVLANASAIRRFVDIGHVAARAQTAARGPQ